MLQVLAKSIVKTDKHNKEYITVRVMDTRSVKETNTNVWLMDYPSIFNCEINAIFPGAIVTKDVQVYELIDDQGVVNTYSKYTAVVIGDTSDTVYFNELVDVKFSRDKRVIIKSPIVSRLPETSPSVSSTNPMITPASRTGYAMAEATSTPAEAQA